MTAVLLLGVGVVVGWMLQSAAARQEVRRSRRTDFLGFEQHHVMGDMAAQRRRAEAEMRRITYQKGGQ